MAEVIGTASAVLAILETVFTVVQHIRKAQHRLKHIQTFISQYFEELDKTKAIIGIVRDERALQTAAVASELLNLEAILKKLAEALDSISKLTMADKKKSPIRRLSIHLIRGSEDEKTLEGIMAQLSQSKNDLSLKIQVANVGLLRTVQGTVVANATAVTQVNRMLKETCGKEWDLKVAQVLRGRSPEEDGTIPLNEADLSMLAGPPPAYNAKDGPQSRIVIANTTYDQALQINGPIGEKGWWEVSHLTIERNTASGDSIQINHGTSMDVFEKLLAARAAGTSSRK